MTTSTVKPDAEAKRPRRTADAQRAAILEAARDVFLEHGFAGASIDAVVERAGGSKATVYALFGNKQGLFGAVVAEGVEQIDAMIGKVPVCASLEESLRAIAQAYLRVVLDPKRVALFRLVAGESGRLPEIGDIFYRMGPQAGLKVTANFFRECAARQLLEVTDPDDLAASFIHATFGDLHFRAVCNPTRWPTKKEIERHIDFAVELFINGVRSPRGQARAPRDARE